jgi:pimeloyl-ACP methyl ester carboxylesterase
VWGDGPETVLLVHGWAGRGLQLGAFAAPLVERGFRVVTYDAPAHGDSPGQTTSLFEMIDALVAVANAFEPVRGVIAHSLGSAATLLATHRQRLNIERAVTLAPVSRTGEMIAWFGDLAGFPQSVLDRMRDRIEKRFDFRWAEIEPQFIAQDLGLGLMVVHDRDDREVPCSEGARLSLWCPHTTFVETVGLGHRRILRQPKVVQHAVDHLCEDRRVACPPPLSTDTQSSQISNRHGARP